MNKRMKILHVIPQVWRGNGAAKLIMDLLPYQLQQCSKVDILVWKEEEPSFEVDIKRIGCGIKILGLKKYNPFILIDFVREAKAYDIVHVHLFPALYWAALAKIFTPKRVKFILTEHSTKNNRQGKVWLQPIEKFVYRRYDKVVAISRAVEKVLRKMLPASKIEVIYNGVNLQSIDNATALGRDTLGVPADAWVLVQVARFTAQKDQKTILRALALLPTSYYVVFVGDGRLLQEHIDYAKTLGVSDRVRFLGMRDDVPKILKMSDVFIMSSHFEGFGLAAVEGMASGIPVIASAVEGLDEVVEGAGLLFAPGDEKGLVHRLMQLTSDRRYYEKVAFACKERSTQFDIAQIAEQYMSLYLKTLNVNS